MILPIVAGMAFASPQVTAWIVGHNPKSLERFRERANQLDAVYMEYYTLSKEGKLIRRDAYKKTVSEAQKVAKAHKVEFLVMLSNYANDDGKEIGFERERVAKAIATKDSRQAFANELVRFLKADGAAGIDLDIESLKAEDKNSYSAFVTTIAGALHHAGLRVSVTVHPKDNLEGNWDGPKAHDYAALGSVADRFNVMTYDFSWDSGPEGPIAPLDWVERVVSFTKTQVSPSKIGLGIACYGYDWSKKPAASMTWEDIGMRSFKVDERSSEFVDGKLHFSGAPAFRAKYQLAKKLGVGSVAFWYCGSEDPDVWKLVPRR